MVDSVEKVPHNETDLVSRLLVSLRHAMQRQREVAAPYLPGADWKRLLESQWRRYDAAMERQNVDAAASLLRNFFRNEGLSEFWGGAYSAYPCRENLFVHRSALTRRRDGSQGPLA